VACYHLSESEANEMLEGVSISREACWSHVGRDAWHVTNYYGDDDSLVATVTTNSESEEYIVDLWQE